MGADHVRGSVLLLLISGDTTRLGEGARPPDTRRQDGLDRCQPDAATAPRAERFPDGRRGPHARRLDDRVVRVPDSFVVPRLVGGQPGLPAQRVYEAAFMAASPSWT